MRTLIGFFAVAVLVSAMAPLAADDQKTDTPKQPEKKTTGPLGQPAYEFTLDAVDGTTVKLADLKGKVVMLDFFETWCPACNAMMPSVVAINAKYKDQGLVVLAIDREKRGDKPEAIKNFVAKYKMDFPVIMLTGDMKKTMWSKYGVEYGIPHYIVIDRKGVVRHKQAGGNSGVLEKTVKKLLDEKS